MSGKDTLSRSIAIINAVEKLKNQGIPITKKAEMDYLLARKYVEKTSKAPGRDLGFFRLNITGLCL